MKLLDAKTSADLVKLLVFIVVTTLATGLLVVMVGNLTFGASKPYKAEFVDATGVVKGDDVRVAGVKVGTVTDVRVHDNRVAGVEFTVQDAVRLPRGTIAQLRFRNLVGQRYISLSQQVGDTTPLEEDAVIDVRNTSPALDLTVLFNGFKPLFQALSPDDINQLSFEIVQVFQGEGGTLESLLGHTASVTKTLADRDEVITDLIVNLDDVLDRIADRDSELSDLIISFKQLVKGLKQDRKPILDSLEQISALSEETASLVTGIRKPFTNDILQLRRFADNVNRNKGELDRALQVLPIKLEKVGRTAIYGSYFNFYLCHFQGRVRLPGGSSIPVDYNVGGARCDLG
ncbi:MlaD family protein [Nocardioides sp. REDSEA-S30_B4]|uniref:MCE family protein n=1 Tax=Nocardioides sp. REDSEA-S30_B4 TaxID=1811552 RepID=UPI000B0470A7|nr:MlaD family protein [Nocardioides sp. REDSEA-S30_B4]